MLVCHKTKQAACATRFEAALRAKLNASALNATSKAELSQEILGIMQNLQ